MKKYISSIFVLAVALSMASAIPVSAETSQYGHGTSTRPDYNRDRDHRDNDRDRRDSRHNWYNNQHRPWDNRNHNNRSRCDRNRWGWDNYRHGQNQNITASGNIRYEAGDLERRASFSIKSNRGRNDRGTGYFNYRDANGDWYRVNVKYVASSDREVYFAGPVVSASDSSWTGYWLYAKVSDSRFGGQIWGSFTDRADAISNFDQRNIADPEDGPFRAWGNINIRVSR